MKVAQIFENEWANKEVTLKYLWKKQLSACHRFVIMAERVEFYNADMTERAMNLLSVQSARGIEPIEISLNRDVGAFKELVKYYYQMKRAKQTYEEAGGEYKVNSNEGV